MLSEYKIQFIPQSIQYFILIQYLYWEVSIWGFNAWVWFSRVFCQFVPLNN